MKATSEKLPGATVLLTVEASPEEMAEAREGAFRRMAPRVAVPGFRPGKAPRTMIEQQIGPERLLSEALEDLLPRMYSQALEQEGVHPYAEGRVQVTQRDPAVMKIEVPVMPTVTLGDYHAIRLSKPAVAVEPGEVDEVIAGLQEEGAEWVPPVENRPVRLGDRVALDLSGAVAGENFVDRKGLDVLVSEENPLVVPGLASELVGAAVGEERKISLPLPETFSVEKLRGQTADFVITVRELKEKVLPEIDDEFAKSVGPEPDLAALRARIESDLLVRKNEEAEERYQEGLIAAVAEISQLDYPEDMVREEVDRLVSRFADRMRGSGLDLDTYLKLTRKSMEEYRKDREPQAHERIRAGLVLNELSNVEAITVAAGEIEAELERLAVGAGANEAEVRKELDSERGRQTLMNLVVERKTFARLAEIASGAPVVSTDSAEPQSDSLVESTSELDG